MALNQPHHVRVGINYRIFAVLVLVALPLIAVGGVIVLGVGQAQSRERYGMQLEQLAERTASTVDTFVIRRILDVSLLARVPELREASVAGGRVPFDAAAARQIDQQWQLELAPPEAVGDILNNQASRFLRDVVQNDAIYSELLLTDARGRLVAASNFTSDYLQADEDWWGDTFKRAGPHISDARWDESARTYAIEIAVPVLAPDSGTVAGVLKAITNSSEMLAAISGVRIGDTGEAALVRRDGSLVYSRRGVPPDTSFFAAALLRESLGLTRTTLQGQPATPADRAANPEFRTHFSARMPDGRRAIVAVGPTQLGVTYPELPWLVAVHQAEDELFAPVRAQIFYFLMLLALVTMAVLVLALWFSMRLVPSPLDLDLHLVKHARVHRVDEEDMEEEGTDQVTAT